MKLIVHVPLSYDREYIDDFDENTIPNKGQKFDKAYVVCEKEIKGDICELTLCKNK